MEANDLLLPRQEQRVHGQDKDCIPADAQAECSNDSREWLGVPQEGPNSTAEMLQHSCQHAYKTPTLPEYSLVLGCSFAQRAGSDP